jgi:hypothetical protein
LDYRGVVVQNSIPLLNEIHAMHVLEKKIQTPRKNALLWACFLPESILCFFFLRALKSLKFAGSLCQGIETLQNGFSPN